MCRAKALSKKNWRLWVSFFFKKAELKLNGTSGDRTQILCTETQNSTPELTRLCPRLIINLEFLVFKASFDKKAMKIEEPSEAESCLFFCALESFLDDFYTFNFCYRFQHGYWTQFFCAKCKGLTTELPNMYDRQTSLKANSLDLMDGKLLSFSQSHNSKALT